MIKTAFFLRNKLAELIVKHELVGNKDARYAINTFIIIML